MDGLSATHKVTKDHELERQNNQKRNKKKERKEKTDTLYCDKAFQEEETQLEALLCIDFIYEKDPQQAGQKQSDCDGIQAQKQSNHQKSQEAQIEAQDWHQKTQK